MKKAFLLTLSVLSTGQILKSSFVSQVKAFSLPGIHKDAPAEHLVQRHTVVTKKHDNETLNEMADHLLAPPTDLKERQYLLNKMNVIGKLHAGAGQRMVIDALIQAENKYKTSQAASIRKQALEYFYISDTRYQCRDLTLENKDLPKECKKIPFPKRNGKAAFSRSVYAAHKLED